MWLGCSLCMCATCKFLDYNECQQSGMCQNGQCLNMEGSYKCACNPGYILADDGVACIGIANIAQHKMTVLIFF